MGLPRARIRGQEFVRTVSFAARDQAESEEEEEENGTDQSDVDVSCLNSSALSRR